MTASTNPFDELGAIPRMRDELESIHREEEIDELKEWIASAQEDFGPHAALMNDPTTIDHLLRRQAREFDHNWAMLVLYIGHARDREIHRDLGFKSWPDYIADVARREMPNVARSVEQRRQVVALLAGEGMSQRAIADAVGVSQKTVDRDLDQVSHDDSPCFPTDFADSAPVTTPDTVTGRDGKQYPAKPKRKPAKPEPEPRPDVPAPSTSSPPKLDPEIAAARQRQLTRFLDWVIQGDILVGAAVSWDYTDMPAEVAQLKEAREHLAEIIEDLDDVTDEFSREQR
jgi:hypothetical protein